MVGAEGGLLGGQGLLNLVAGVDQEDGGVCGLQKISLLLMNVLAVKFLNEIHATLMQWSVFHSHHDGR